MRRPLLLGVGFLLPPMAALAVGDIPTRYSGSFPSDGLRTNISGTFTGKSLTLKWSVVARGTPVRRTFAGSCAATSPTQTRCTGRIRGSGSDQFNEPADAVVTWSAGKPAAITFIK